MADRVDPARAAAIGLVAHPDGKISARGEFIVSPDSVAESEDRRMRGYRYKEYPKAVNRWNGSENEQTTAETKADEETLLASGWSLDPQTGSVEPKGKKKTEV